MKIFNSTPAPHLDPLPFRNKLGERFPYRNGADFFSLEYSPRISFTMERRYPANLTLLAFRKGPMTVDSALEFLATLPRWPGQYEHARAVLARWLAVYHDYGTGRRLIAVGIKIAPFATVHTTYATGEPKWNPQHEDDDADVDLEHGRYPHTDPRDPSDVRKQRLEGEDI